MYIPVEKESDTRTRRRSAVPPPGTDTPQGRGKSVDYSWVDGARGGNAPPPKDTWGEVPVSEGTFFLVGGERPILPDSVGSGVFKEGLFE